MEYAAKNRQEQGLVSIIVTMVMILVISLIVIGFSEVTRHNQREALDRQLSTQAFYAAESGVNAASKALLSTSPGPVLNAADNTSCTQFANDNSLVTTLNSASKVAYTCLLVDATPTLLQQKPLKQQANTVWPLIDDAGNSINKFKFSFASNTHATGSAAAGVCTDAPGVFPPANTRTCNFGVLRIDLLQYDNTNPSDPAIAGPDQAASLASHTVTIYVQATNSTSANTIADFSNDAGRAKVVQCAVSGTTCNADINLTGAASSKSYYARLTMLYQDSDSVSVTATDVSGPVHFQNAQAVIDSTGKAQDELRRILVRVPLTSPNDANLPTNGVQSTGSICKLLTVGPTTPYTADPCP